MHGLLERGKRVTSLDRVVALLDARITRREEGWHRVLRGSLGVYSSRRRVLVERRRW
jgi:hypothetical protein